MPRVLGAYDVNPPFSADGLASAADFFTDALTFIPLETGYA